MPSTNDGFEFRINPNIIRQVLFLGIILFIGVIIIKEMYFMMSAFLGAISLHVILDHPRKYLQTIWRWPSWLAALVLMILSLVVMVLPLIYMTSIAIDKLTPLINNPSQFNSVFSSIHDYLLSRFNIDVLNNENVQKITGQVVPIAQKTLGGTFTALGNVFLMYLVLYFMMTEAQKLRAWIRKNLPLKLTNAKKVTQEINSLVFSNTIGIPMVAIIQGVVGVIGYWLFGVEEFILMGMLTAIASVIPLVGTMIIYLPLAVYQFAMGDTFNGIGILLWGFIVIGSVDNIARFLIQKKLADVHPLVTLLGVIIGVNMFGFIGIIFGPLLLSIFFILVRVYVDEFGRTTNLPTDEVAKG